MNFDSPGWARIAILCLILSIVNSQHESHEGSNGKNHLSGIRRLSIQRISQNRPVQVPSDGGMKRYLTNLTPAVVSSEALEPSWPEYSRKKHAPYAEMPIMDSHEDINYERRINLLPVNARVHGAPTQIINHEKPKSFFRPTTEAPKPEMTQEDMDKKRQERIAARWKKLGFTGRPITLNGPYSNIKMVHYASPVVWTHAPTVEKTTQPPTTTTKPKTTPRHPSPPKTRQFPPDVIKPKKEEPMIRRINKHPIHVETDPPNPRGFGSKSFFTGPILDENDKEIIVPPSQPITVSRSSENEFTDDSIVLEDTSKKDYHNRAQNSNPVSVKRLKLKNRLTYRPRLKIRRPEEIHAAKSDSGRNLYPLSLPELDPLDGRKPLPSSGFEEPPTAFMTRHRIHPSQRLQGLNPLPSVSQGGEQTIQVEPPPPPPNYSPKKPQVTGWGDEEDFSEVITEDNGFGGGDSGAGFGGEVGTPPPGFQEAFGLNGGSMKITTPKPTTPPTTTTRRTTKRPTTKPPPDEPFIIPENSGLRPVAPPKEFTGGFGSSRGSPISGFGGGGFGGGGGLPPSGPPAKPKPKPRPKPKGNNRKPASPPPEITEEQFYTGDSALMPNRRGPSGDGYGPPVLPDINPPPPVPSINVGGGAAGIPQGPPMMPMSMRNVLPENENTATTVKPSALLSILNKADEGFNQALTHFERGTPIETAAIDILEVALGSQKLESQAKLLGHVDRTFGLDNLQRLQRWANTGGAFDMLKEQFAKVVKNYKVPEPTVTIPPQLDYLFAPSG